MKWSIVHLASKNGKHHKWNLNDRYLDLERVVKLPANRIYRLFHSLREERQKLMPWEVMNEKIQGQLRDLD